MNLDAAANLARELMDQHGLSDWRFRWSRSRSMFGDCCPRRRTIRLSHALTEVRPEEKVRNTILHEIAHALTPGHHHDAVWKLKAAEVGAIPERCSDRTDYLPKKYRAICVGCGEEHFSDKWSMCSCGKCSGGRFNRNYILRWEPNQPTPAVDNRGQYALFEVTQ